MQRLLIALVLAWTATVSGASELRGTSPIDSRPLRAQRGAPLPGASPQATAFALAIERDGVNVRLEWTEIGSGVSTYEVWRSDSPYRPAGGTSARLAALAAQGAGTTVLYTDWGAALTYPAVNHHYLVRGLGAGGSVVAESSRAAEFDFTLREPAHWQPAPGTSWQWQLTGNLVTGYDVQMYDIDLFDTQQSQIDDLHAAGRVVVCYFSAGSWEDWRPDADDFPPALLGNGLDGWPGERWLDIRQLAMLAPIMEARLDLAASKGCDGVEPDNVDAYTYPPAETGFALTAMHQAAYNTWLAKAAHARGLSAGLKNDLDQVTALLPYFDWALDEQCFQYNECSLLDPFVAAGKAVFGVEYQGDPAVFCPKANARQFSWLKKHVDLDHRRIDCRSY